VVEGGPEVVDYLANDYRETKRGLLPEILDGVGPALCLCLEVNPELMRLTCDPRSDFSLQGIELFEGTADLFPSSRKRRGHGGLSSSYAERAGDPR
jgi:hypothetical protein